jgi:hypothetical protein
LVGFDADELARLLAAEDAVEGLTDEDAAPALAEVAVSAPGDLWTLGSHKLFVGDATVPADVARLMAGGTAVSFVLVASLRAELKDGLVAYYSEDSATAHPDSVGTSPGRTISGTPLFMTGKLGGAYDFSATGNGNDPRVSSTLPNVASWRGGSVSAWIKPSVYASGNLEDFFQIQEGRSFGHLTGAMHPTTKKIIFLIGTGTSEVVIQSTTTPGNDWYFVTMTWDKITNRATLFVNGQEEATTPMSA